MADFALSLDEIRAVAAYAVACADPALVVFEKVRPADDRPRAAIAAGRIFAEGAPRTRLQRTAAADAGRAAKEAPTEAARHAARAAAAASAAAYLHPLANATQVGHILGAAAHAARAAELHRGDDPVVAEYILDAAAKRMTPTVREVLSRYPRVVAGRSRVSILMARLDSLLRDPAPPTRVVDDPGPFFHGTRAAVQVGDLLSPGWQSNYGSRRRSNHIYVTASEWGAPLAAELAQGEGPPRVYRVEALGMLHDDPNVTDKRFPGNPTRSYRTTEPIRVLEEMTGWERPDPALIERMRAGQAELAELGIEAMDD
ncbi:MAG TPA: NAD(+)--rifampin ADP-ribosyltransferase [Phycicoccus sp.]|nr:NAD(+)--rifampin ADP-ribosyltransferase [Phycicoccus sp.]